MPNHTLTSEAPGAANRFFISFRMTGENLVFIYEQIRVQ
jgi:hypothetical protein